MQLQWGAGRLQASQVGSGNVIEAAASRVTSRRRTSENMMVDDYMLSSNTRFGRIVRSLHSKALLLLDSGGHLLHF